MASILALFDFVNCLSTVKNINHLGIVAGIIDELQIVDIINQEARNRRARNS